jgi:ketosteroid isomerase-like protein
MSMTRAIALLAIATIGVTIVHGAQQTPATQKSAEDEILQRYRDWEIAAVKRDYSRFERDAMDDYLCVTREGVVLDKPTCLKLLKESAIESWKCDQMKIRLYGDMAVATGRTTVKGKLDGKDEDRLSRCTEVWIRQGDRWRLASSQFTPIAQPQSP